MREVTMYESLDGMAWRTKDAAEERDKEFRVASEIEAFVGDRVPNLSGWVQRDLVRVGEMKRALAAAAMKAQPDFWDRYLDPVAAINPNSLMTRIMSESEGPLSSAWPRACRIDEHGREWEQLYWVGHQIEGLKKFPKPFEP